MPRKLFQIKLEQNLKIYRKSISIVQMSKTSKIVCLLSNYPFKRNSINWQAPTINYDIFFFCFLSLLLWILIDHLVSNMLQDFRFNFWRETRYIVAFLAEHGNHQKPNIFNFVGGQFYLKQHCNACMHYYRTRIYI